MGFCFWVNQDSQRGLGSLGERSGEILEGFRLDRDLGFRGGERRRTVGSGLDEEHGLFSGFIWFSGLMFLVFFKLFMGKRAFDLRKGKRRVV